MVKVYDMIILKYRSQRKSKEEIIKYIMRKAFKFLFKTLQNQSDKHISLQDAHKLCLEHYFKNANEEFNDILVLPFRKESKIKTMNMQFLEKVFSSQQFVNDYKVFIEQLEEILEKDNQKKFLNTNNNIAKLIANGQLEVVNSKITISKQKIRTLRRMPWTIANLEEVGRVSYQLLEMFSGDKSNSGTTVSVSTTDLVSNQSFKQVSKKIKQ